MKKVLTIGLSDSSAMTGIQADLKTFSSARVYGACVVSAVTAQNTLGLSGIHTVPMEFVGQQLDALLSDIEFDGVKIGFLCDERVIDLVHAVVGAMASQVVVVDPVFSGPNGERPISDRIIEAYGAKIVPLATVATPNMQEAAKLVGFPVTGLPEMKEAATVIVERGARFAVVTGGKLEGRAVDMLYDRNLYHTFDSARHVTSESRGLGCTFAASLCAFLVRGMTLRESVQRSKHYVDKAMRHQIELGKGGKPLNHRVPV